MNKEVAPDKINFWPDRELERKCADLKGENEALEQNIKILREDKDHYGRQCAAMRDALEEIREGTDTGREWACMDVWSLACAALGGDAGKGWVSPKEFTKLLEAFQKLAKRMDASTEVLAAAIAARDKWRSTRRNAHTPDSSARKERMVYSARVADDELSRLMDNPKEPIKSNKDAQDVQS